MGTPLRPSNFKHRIARFGRQLVVAAFAAIVLWSVVLMFLEERLIFFPATYPSGAYEDAKFIPGLRDEFFLTADGVKLHAWYVPSESSRATIIYSHGNGGNLTYGVELYRRLQNSGYSVFAFDYRGYGRSDGSATEAGIYRDAISAYDHVVHELKVNPSRIILWGFSLGGAVTVHLATERPAAGLILESTFSSGKDVAANAYPFLPTRWLMRSEFNSSTLIKDIEIPKLHMHGDRDEIIPIELGKRLYEAAQGSKQWHIITGAGHNDGYVVGGEEFLTTVARFIDSAVGH